MKTFLAKPILAVLGVVLCIIPVAAQSLSSSLEAFHQDFLQQKNQSIIINTTARDLAKEDEILDREQFVYTKDSKGFYFNIMGIEILQDDQWMVRIDHEFEQVILSAAGKQSDALSNWLNGLQQAENTSNIEAVEEAGNTIFSFTEANGKLTMKIILTGKRIKKIIQYPEETEYEGAMIQPILEMDYVYLPAQKRISIPQVLRFKNDKIILAKQYTHYELVDLRNNQKTER